jgi:hypothetical protein
MHFFRALDHHQQDNEQALPQWAGTSSTHKIACFGKATGTSVSSLYYPQSCIWNHKHLIDKLNNKKTLNYSKTIFIENLI